MGLACLAREWVIRPAGGPAGRQASQAAWPARPAGRPARLATGKLTGALPAGRLAKLAGSAGPPAGRAGHLMM